jgi:hypothetical protein
MSGMKASTIRVSLRAAMNKWLDSIEDKSVREMARRDAFITGGAIASMLQGEMPNDLDIYFKSKHTVLAVANYYVEQFKANKMAKFNLETLAHAANPDLPRPRSPWMHEPKVIEATVANCQGVREERVVVFMKSSGVASETQGEYQYFETRAEIETDEFFTSLKIEDAEYDKFADNPVEYTEQLAEEVDKPGPGRPKKTTQIPKKFRPVFLSENAITLSDRVQVVLRFYGEPATIHVNYDYAHCMCWYDHYQGVLELPKEALQAILSKTLIYKGSLYPLASIFRLRKFISRGWRITAGQLLKIMMQISTLDLRDVSVLREQLVGVDQAYMHQLLRALEEKDIVIDQAYITNLIDQIFED